MQSKSSSLLQSGTKPFEQNVPVEQRGTTVNPLEEDVEVVVDDVVEVVLEVFVEQTKAMSGLQSKDIPMVLQHSRDWKFGSPKHVGV